MVGLGRFELPTYGLGIQSAVLIGVENSRLHTGAGEGRASRPRLHGLEKPCLRSDGVSAWLSKELESGRMAEKKEYRPMPPVRVGFGPISLARDQETVNGFLAQFREEFGQKHRHIFRSYH